MTADIIRTLRAVARDTSTSLGAQLHSLGLTVPQAEYLATVAANPHYSGADAASACHVSPQTGTTLLQNLAAQHLIILTSPPGTGRRHTITVTPEGHETLAKAQAITAGFGADLASRLGEDACRKLHEIYHATPKRAPKQAVERTSKRAAKARKTAKPKPATVGRRAANIHDRCRTWAADTSTPNFVPEHIAHAFGTPALVKQLVTTGAWTPSGNGYRIS